MALQAAGRARVRVLVIVVIAIAGLAALVWSRRQHSDPETASVNSASPSPIPSGTTSPVITQSRETPTPEKTPERTPSPANVAAPTDSFSGTVKLIVPVVGVKPDQLVDTFADARSEGRVHDAIDILAPAGTPVVAVADGEIIKLFQSERGGTTIYQLSSDRRLVFYYAHLQRYADALAAGMFVKQGDVIAYVGDTGNAGTGNFHLHFSISVVADPKRYWEGTNINPYPLLRK